MANYSYKTQGLLQGAQNCAGASTKAETGRETFVSLCSHFGVPDLTREGGTSRETPNIPLSLVVMIVAIHPHSRFL